MESGGAEEMMETSGEMGSGRRKWTSSGWNLSRRSKITRTKLSRSRRRRWPRRSQRAMPRRREAETLTRGKRLRFCSCSKSEFSPDRTSRGMLTTIWRSMPGNLDNSSSSSSSEQSAPLNGAETGKKAQKRSRPSLEVDPHANPRSTRRNSQLEDPTRPVASGSGLARPPKPRTSSHGRMARPSDPAVDRKSSRPQLLSARSGGSSNEGEVVPNRSTRRSAPLAGTLADMLKDPAVMSVAGGFDPVAGRYVARGRVAEGPDFPPMAPLTAPPTPPPRPATAPPPSSAPQAVKAPSPASRPPPRPRPVSLHSGDLRRYIASPKERRASSGAASRPILSPGPRPASPATPSASARSTRLSAPIEGSLNQLIASPAVAAVAGGYDAEAGRYTSTRRILGSAGAPSTPVVAPPASPAESSRGTRSRAPLQGMTVADLVASPEAQAVSGGYNPATGKYMGIRKRGTGSASPQVGQPRS